MQTRTTAARFSWTAALAPWLVAGCQSMIGLDTPHLSGDAATAALDGGHGDHDAGAVDGGADFDASPAVVMACNSFCDDIGSSCNGKDGPQAYPRPEACQDVCLHYDHTSTATVGPTFACRRQRADLVAPLIGSRAELKAVSAYCAMLSVGGEDDSGNADVESCGSNCENYCQLRQDLCGLDRSMEDCVSQCGMLVDTGSVNAGQDFDTHPDSVQCRLAHLSMAATPNGASVHCEHSRINPIRDVDPMTGKPTGLSCDLGDDTSRGDLCDNYCHLVTRVCSGTNEAVWTDEAECLRACKNPNSLALGQLSDHDQDTWGCRRTHSYIALEEDAPVGQPKSHCSHASIGGGGDHCGGNACDVYCNLLASNCKADFATSFPGGAANCVEKCGDFQGVQQGGKSVRYSTTLGAVAGDTYACRLHSLIAVLAGDATSCPAAVGSAAPCRD